MRRISLALAIGGLLAMAIVGPVTAQRAVHITGIPIEFSFVDPDLSDACGYEVTVSQTGTGSATLLYNAAGLIIREVDTEPGARITFSGNGNAFSYPANTVLVTSYPEGATIDAPAYAILTGFFGKIPGAIPNAGPDIITGHVIDFTQEGLPVITFDDAVSHGPRGPEDFLSAVCAALDD
jgi:hypothetical protein